MDDNIATNSPYNFSWVSKGEDFSFSELVMFLLWYFCHSIQSIFLLSQLSLLCLCLFSKVKLKISASILMSEHHMLQSVCFVNGLGQIFTSGVFSYGFTSFIKTVRAYTISERFCSETESYFYPLLLSIIFWDWLRFFESFVIIFSCFGVYITIHSWFFDQCFKNKMNILLNIILNRNWEET